MIDRLTALPNIVGLLDWITHFSCQNHPFPFSLAAIHLTALWQVNRTAGRDAGDALLQQCARSLQENHAGPVFRAGGDKFLVFMENAAADSHVRQAQQLAQAIGAGWKNPALPPVRVALIHFTQEQEFTPGNVLACLFVSLSDHFHENAGGLPLEFTAGQIRDMREYPWMVIDLAEQMMHMGNTVYHFAQLARTDSITQLPNLRAAMQEIEADLELAQRQQTPFAVLMIDGDNLRQFNTLSYEAGDEAIRLIGTTLQQQLRPADFLARFRSGDEFLVLLRGTPHAQALATAQRLCQAVENASSSWEFHTTISIGVALYPQHGSSMQNLLCRAENGLRQAKQQGKNQAVVWEADAQPESLK